MTGPGPQQNSTTPVSPLVVANAHTNGDEEPLFPNRSLTWVARFRCGDSAGGLTAASAEVTPGSSGISD